MAVEYQVLAVPPGKSEQTFFAAFVPSRWQWAEKLAQYLRDKGYAEVEVVRCIEQDSQKEK